MKRSNPILSLSCLLLSAALSAGCGVPTAESEPYAPEAAQALAADSCAPGAPTFEVTPRPDGSFHFFSAGVVCRPSGAVWAKIRNFDNVIAIFLDGIASDFEWVDGGSPGKLPSRYQFSVAGTTLLEEVDYRSDPDQVIGYHLVTPGLGIERYSATIELEAEGPHATRVTFTRAMRFADPALVDGFAELFQVEMANFQDYFASDP